MQKSVLVAVDRFVKHTKYDRILKRTTKLMAHDEEDACNIGDTVRIHSCRCVRGAVPGGTPVRRSRERWQGPALTHAGPPPRCRPLSKRKCWEVTQVLHRARVFDADAARAATKQQQGAGAGPSFAASAVPQS